jgi:hypothetical protein
MRALASTDELLSCIIVERDNELWFAWPAVPLFTYKLLYGKTAILGCGY